MGWVDLWTCSFRFTEDDPHQHHHPSLARVYSTRRTRSHQTAPKHAQKTYTVLLGALYFRIGTVGIAAVQNRMGIFMLEALFLAFTSVSALPVSKALLCAYVVLCVCCACVVSVLLCLCCVALLTRVGIF